MLLGVSAISLRADDKEYKPDIVPSEFSSKVTNPYFPLPVGMVTKCVENDGRKITEIVTTVLPDTKEIMGVKCVVVHDVASVGGKIEEDTYDWYAQQKDGSVWYFGEDTKEYLSGGRVETKGSWEGGVKGAQPGIIMPGTPQVGMRYRQEYLKGEAEDMGEITALNVPVTVKAGTFEKCVQTRDWSELEAGSEKKYFAPGVGFVKSSAKKDSGSEAVSITQK